VCALSHCVNEKRWNIKKNSCIFKCPITAPIVDLFMLDTFSLRQAAEKLNMHIYCGLLIIRECKKLVAVFVELPPMLDGFSIHLQC